MVFDRIGFTNRSYKQPLAAASQSKAITGKTA
jgi:hypothetical protein